MKDIQSCPWCGWEGIRQYQDTPDVWYLSVGNISTRVKFCPQCGKELAGPQKDEIPVWVDDPGGHG